jgi:hypothetical protein
MIGNPYSVGFRGLTAQLLYGKDFEAAYVKTPKVEISLTDELPAAAWIAIPIVITPSKPEDLRELYIQESTFRSMNARRPPSK